MRLFVALDGHVIAYLAKAAYSRAHVAKTKKVERKWREALADRRIPEDVGYAISSEGAQVLMDEIVRENNAPAVLGPKGLRFVKCALSLQRAGPVDESSSKRPCSWSAATP